MSTVYGPIDLTQIGDCKRPRWSETEDYIISIQFAHRFLDYHQ
jgi:hypothetical protein